MRIAPDRDHRRGLHRPMKYVALRQIGDGARPLAIAHSAKPALAQHDIALGGQ